jgi:histidinol phosphatase-like PHP family hydrolase
MRIARSIRCRTCAGEESDILADGSLDYADDVLERFDFVAASIHGRFKLDRKAQTQLLLRAISHPHTAIIGHMTGRQLQRRPGYEIDVEKVLRACAKHDVAVEINAHPWRLDLDWRWHQAALEFGCMMSINPDAHSIPELDHMHWGVEMARRAVSPPTGSSMRCLSRRLRATSAISGARSPGRPGAAGAWVLAGGHRSRGRRRSRSPLQQAASGSDHAR